MNSDKQTGKIYTIRMKTVLEPFANLRYRKATVLILCQDEQGRFLLGAKPYLYPEGISRVLGGGVDENEDVKRAAQREIEEELNFHVDLEKIEHLCDVVAHAESPTKEYTMTSHVYFAPVDSTKITAGDDVKSIVYLSEAEYLETAYKLLSLPADLIYDGKEGHYSWGDFGQVYGFIQITSLNEFKSLKNRDK